MIIFGSLNFLVFSRSIEQDRGISGMPRADNKFAFPISLKICSVAFQNENDAWNSTKKIDYINVTSKWAYVI